MCYSRHIRRKREPSFIPTSTPSPQRTLTRRVREVSLWERQELRPQERIRARALTAEGKLQPPAPGRAAPAARAVPARGIPGRARICPAVARPFQRLYGARPQQRQADSGPSARSGVLTYPAPHLAVPVSSEAPCPKGFGLWWRWPGIFPSVPLPPQLPSHPKGVQRG